jgi:alcohol dehydrogenase
MKELSAGTDGVIGYTWERFEDTVHHFDGTFDVIGGSTLARTFSVVKPGKKVVSIAGMPEPMTALKDLHLRFDLAVLFLFGSLTIHLLALSHGVFYRYVFMHPSGAELAELSGLIDSGRLRVVIDRVFPFDEIDKAFAYLEAGHAKGKVIVRIAYNEME